MFKFLCWVWGILLVLFMVGLMVPSTPSKSQHAGSSVVRIPERVAATASRDVVLTRVNWTKGGFDTIMMLDFTIRNDNDYAVKDITIRCDHFARSGTNIDSNTRTVYERIPAYGSISHSQFNMGFIHSQILDTSCKVVGFVQV